jgi:hypothetical protein
MPHLQQPMELRETPSLPRRMLRLAMIVGVTAGLFIFALAIVVLAMTP